MSPPRVLRVLLRRLVAALADVLDRRTVASGGRRRRHGRAGVDEADAAAGSTAQAAATGGDVHASPGAAAAGDNALVAAAVCDAHVVAAAGGTAAVSAGTVVHAADTAAEVQGPAASAPLDVMAAGTTKDEEHDHVVSVSSVEEATAVCGERDESDGCIPSTKVWRESDRSGAAARGLGVHVTCRAKLKPSCSPAHSRGRAPSRQLAWLGLCVWPKTHRVCRFAAWGPRRAHSTLFRLQDFTRPMLHI